MYAQVEKIKESSFPANRQQSGALVNSAVQKKSNVKQGFRFVDNRPHAIQMQNNVGVIQAVWAYVNDANGEHLNLKRNSDNTYIHSDTGRRFRHSGSDGNRIIVTEIVEDGNSEGQKDVEEQKRPNVRPHDSDVHELEPPKVRLRLSKPKSSRGELEEEKEQEQEMSTLTPEEFRQIDQAETYRFAKNGRVKRLYGDEDFIGRACWNWALSGGHGDPINPSHLFDMLSDESHKPREPLFTKTFKDAWHRYLPQPVEGQSQEQQQRTNQQREAYNQHKDQIHILWNRRRSMNESNRRGRRNSSSSESIENITNDAVRLSMEMNGLEPAERGENSPFSIAMARHPDKGVNWSHWGLEVNKHSFETIPGWGLWHQKDGFDYWANQTGSIEDSQVTRVPLKNPTAAHMEGVRGLLNIMREAKRTNSSSRGRGRRSNAQTPSSR